MGSCGCGAGARHAPDVAQAARVRDQLSVSLHNDVVRERRAIPGARVANGDCPPVHAFPERSRIVQASQFADAAVNDSGFPHLPGRIPAAGWDGEMTAMTPIEGRTY